MNVPELQRTMEEMRQEMMRAEIADEMMEEGSGPFKSDLIKYYTN